MCPTRWPRHQAGLLRPGRQLVKGESISYVGRALIKRDAMLYDYMDKQAVQRLVMEHLEGKQNRRLLIWSLINVENWLDQTMTGEAGA